MSKDKKDIYTGIIEKDEKGNYHCGQYMLDYKTVASGYKEGDKITIRSVIENPSDISYHDYPMKSRDFVRAEKKFIKTPRTEEDN